MSNAEQGIAQAQMAAARAQSNQADAVARQQKRGVAYLDERIFIYLGAIAFVGLCVLWATASSAWLLYGSLGLVILLTVLWGVARVKRIERIRLERKRVAEAMKREDSA